MTICIIKVVLEKHFGCTRFVYNYFLNRRIQHYTSTTYYEQARELTQLKQQLSWLKEASSHSLQFALRSLDTAYRKAFTS